MDQDQIAEVIVERPSVRRLYERVIGGAGSGPDTDGGTSTSSSHSTNTTGSANTTGTNTTGSANTTRTNSTTTRTTADGTVRLHPDAYGAGDGPFQISAGDASVSAGPAGEPLLATGLPTVDGESTVDLDVLFLLNSTGSMGDEIDQLKATIHEVARRITSLPGDIRTRMGMTLYRDLDDSFVTATFDFTDRVDDFAAALANVTADGGGDYPEARGVGS